MDFVNMCKILIYALEIMFHFLACNSASIKLGSYKGLVKTYKNEYDDIFDCIDIYHQLSLGHQFLANHTIQLKPTKYPKNIKCLQDSKIQKRWNITNHCPKGSIPVIRSHKHDARNNNYYRKTQIAQVGKTVTRDRYYGAGAILEVWNPTLADSAESSLAQVKLVKRYHQTKRSENSISVGWRVHQHPNQRNRSVTRFFIRWTADGYQNTGCYNLECAGFIQTNHLVEIDGALPIHSLMAILIDKDPITKNWWLYKDCVPVGYWPQNIFTYHFGEYATGAFFGGEVTNMNFGYHHPTTEMGSGQIPNKGREPAASINSIQVKKHLNELPIALANPKLYMTAPNLYHVMLTVPPVASYGVTIHYGGPEYRPRE